MLLFAPCINLLPLGTPGQWGQQGLGMERGGLTVLRSAWMRHWGGVQLLPAHFGGVLLCPKPSATFDCIRQLLKFGGGGSGCS